MADEDPEEKPHLPWQQVCISNGILVAIDWRGNLWMCAVYSDGTQKLWQKLD